jgi:hypothetical protein
MPDEQEAAALTDLQVIEAFLDAVQSAMALRHSVAWPDAPLPVDWREERAADPEKFAREETEILLPGIRAVLALQARALQGNTPS